MTKIYTFIQIALTITVTAFVYNKQLKSPDCVTKY